MQPRAQSPPARIFDLLAAAHAEPSHERTLGFLLSALKECEQWDSEKTGIDAKLVMVQVLTELALEETIGSKRGDRWRRAVDVIEIESKRTPDPRVASTFGFVAVDCFQDILSDIPYGARVATLRSARDSLDGAIRQYQSTADAASLLSRKSSVLRHLAMTDVTEYQQIQRFEESHRCAAKAVENARTEETLLELALSEWAVAARENSDQKYVERLRSAEGHLRDGMLVHSEAAQLSLARLCRLTFRPLDACEQFRKVTRDVTNRRRVLRDAYIYAEAAIQLWYRTYPDEIVGQHLKAARQLLEEALAAGIKTGRHIVDLCQLGAILDGAYAGTTALSEIFTGEGNVSWEEALRLAAQASLDKNIDSAFVLGINDGSVWTSLGTFIYKFLRDNELAEALYRNAVKLDPKDPVALTNIARFLVRKGDRASLDEARRQLQKAQNFADRRFTWWRAVQAELLKREERKLPDAGKRPAPRTIPTQPQAPPKDLKEVIRRFKAIERLEDQSQRGLQLEQVVYELAKLTFGIAESSYRINRVGGGVSQIDGYFRHASDRYRVECKWKKDPIGQDEIFLFKERLDVPGVAGLVISMSGFTETAKQAAAEARKDRIILLMDGDEARAVLEGRMNFDEVLTRKRSYFDQRSGTYYRVLQEDSARDGSAVLRPDFEVFLASAGAETSTTGFQDWAGGDRVTLAIVFTDVIGSTSLGEEIRDEAMDEVRRAHFSQSRKLIQRFNGREIKTIGDSFMVAFKSAIDALDYSLSLQAETGHPRVRIRVGIHIGPMQVEEGDVFGGTVNFAARVVGAIEGPEIWISDRAKEDVERLGAARHRHLDLRLNEGVAMKGFSGLFKLWAVQKPSH